MTSRPTEKVSTSNTDEFSNSGTYIALLRGINVGGKNKLPMKVLKLLEMVGTDSVPPP